MTDQRALDRFLPPEAPLDMPYQVIERRRDVPGTWLDLLRQVAARRAPHE